MVYPQIKEIFITCDPADFNYIYQNYHLDIYIPITLTYNGITWSDVKMRIRGDGSRQLPKKSLKVKFFGQPFINGRNELNFNAEYEDESYIRATLSSMIFQMAGQKCFHTEHVRLYLNGSFFGLYNMTENMDADFLISRGLDPQGNLYKAAKDGACLSIYDDLVNFWEQKTGTGNKEDLALLIHQLHQVSAEDYPSWLAGQMDYTHAINIIALNMVTGNQSTYYHNYYMYRDARGTGKWEMMPWDLDKTLSVYAWRNFTYSSAPWTHDNPFLEKAILNPSMLQDIKTRANIIFDDIFRADIFWPIIDSLVSVLSPSVEEDTTDNIPSVAHWLSKVETEKQHFLTFPAKLNWYFDNLQSSFICIPTPGYYTDSVMLRWTTSVDPSGLPVMYKVLLTSGEQFEPQLTQVFEPIYDTFLILRDLQPGNYFWKVISIGQIGQEVEGYDSKNRLLVRNLEVLPCVIDTEYTLTEESSPYLVSCNVIVQPAGRLILEAGTELLFQPHTHLLVKGGFVANGIKGKPVIIKPSDENGFFDSLVFLNPSSTIVMNHLHLYDGAIHANFADIRMKNCQLILDHKTLVGQNVIYGNYHGRGHFLNSKIIGNKTGQGLEFGWCSEVIVENSEFSDIDDPIELISVNSGVVKGNYIIRSGDDGIDFNHCKNLLIEGNRIFQCLDNGITIGNEFNGPCENILIRNNLIVDCTIGITVKDGSNAVSDRNTLSANKTAFKIWEKNSGLGGGQLKIVNTIISNTLQCVLDVDSLSHYEITYSLCDTHSIEGNGNLFTSPGFINPALYNFELVSGSPCIDSGDPDSPPDPDFTRADRGAFFFNQGLYHIIFNEINYKSPSDYNTGDWVELYNADTVPAYLAGWEFKDSKDTHTFRIPFGTILKPGEYLVICNDIGLFSQKHPTAENVLGNFAFGLSSKGELIRLYSNTGVLVDDVYFSSSPPWPTSPNGNGPTLELRSPLWNNNLAENWCASVNYGTPGFRNSCFIEQIPEIFSSSQNIPFKIRIYPNPSSDIVNLEILPHFNGTVITEIYNINGHRKYHTQIPVFSETKIIHTIGRFNRGVYLVKALGIGENIHFYQSARMVIF